MEHLKVIDPRNGQEYQFPILSPTLGPDVVDLSSFYKETGMFTYDPGFTSTASCDSDITFINGEKGELLYRGYRIDKLVEKYSFLDVAYLLLKKELPTEEQSAEFQSDIMNHTLIHEGLKNLFLAFPQDAHPMALMSGATSSLSAFYFDHLDPKTLDEFLEIAQKIIAKIPTIAAYSYRYSKGLPFVYPDVNRGFTENFLYMMRSYPSGKTEISDVEIEALDTIFSLHAEHEQNASTSTVRLVGSTGAHPYGAISAAINALWGRAHGGANESVIAQLEMIGSVDRVDEFIAKVKDPENPFRLMGFGHRVYKNFDPRAKILKKLLDKLKGDLNVNSQLLEVAEKIENIALNDEYFIKRKLYPNIDFYSGLLLTAMKIPKNMFTIIFVIGRSTGWIAQWIEMKQDPKLKISRPRQRYIGEKHRDF
jgi:citrate synthase